MTTLGIIQARMGSSRLPGKVLMTLYGEPSILRMLERVSRATSLDELWLATSDEAKDDVLAETVSKAGYRVFRGAELDVLDRFHRLALSRSADTVVRLTGDCPLHDPAVIDQVVSVFHSAGPGIAYVGNTLPPTFPDGLDVEVFSYRALEQLATGSTSAAEREHVTLGIHRNHLPSDQRPLTLNVVAPADFGHLRWTLDNQEDYQFISAVFQELYPAHPDFGWQDVIALLTRHPDLMAINARHVRNEKLARDLGLEEARDPRKG